MRYILVTEPMCWFPKRHWHQLTPLCSLHQEILCDHQATLCSSLRPIYLQCGGSGSTQQNPKCSEPDERRPEDPSKCFGETELILMVQYPSHELGPPGEGFPAEMWDSYSEASRQKGVSQCKHCKIENHHVARFVGFHKVISCFCGYHVFCADYVKRNKYLFSEETSVLHSKVTGRKKGQSSVCQQEKEEGWTTTTKHDL